MAEERREGFADFIEALTIMNARVSGHAGTHCEHDELTVCGVDPADFSKEELARLDSLGFFVTDEYGQSDLCFKSFRWGSC